MFKVNDTARLVSQPLTIQKSGFCFRWFYHMYGPSLNVLNVKLENLSSYKIKS